MYRVVIRPEPVVASTIKEAVDILVAAIKADPKVTYMPYIVNEDGSRLSDEDQQVHDRLFDAADMGNDEEEEDEPDTFSLTVTEAEAIRAYIAGDSFDADLVGQLQQRLDRFVNENASIEEEEL